MKRGKEFKVFTMIMAVLMVVSLGVTFDLTQNGHLIQFGQKANAMVANSWKTADMPDVRQRHAQSTLLDGRILVTGGCGNSGDSQNTAWIYDPTTNIWSGVANMPDVRQYHAQSTLLDGRILVTGGFGIGLPQNTAWIYNPTTNSWSVAANMPMGLENHAQSTLSDGRVLVTGGYSNSGGYYGYQYAAYIYNPTTNSWSSATNMPQSRTYHSQATLKDGRVLISGGYYENNTTLTFVTYSFIYNPSSNSWSYAANGGGPYIGSSTLSDGRVLCGANNIYNPSSDSWSIISAPSDGGLNSISLMAQSTLPDGRVVITGGYQYGSGAINRVYIYDPSTDSWNTGTPPASYFFGQSVLANGNILVTGGYVTWCGTSYCEIFNPITLKTTYASSLPDSIWGNGQSTLNDGRVLVTGGVSYNNSRSNNAAYIYTPSANSWSNAANMPAARYNHAQSTLLDGRVLVTGGYNSGSQPTNTAYIYTPSTNTWSNAANMPDLRAYHAQSTLSDGRVLVTGGYDSSYCPTNTAWLYNPATNTWSSAANMPDIRFSQAQSTISGNRALVTGGSNWSQGNNNAWIYNAYSNTWTMTTPLPEARYEHGQSTLPDGRVIVMGGQGTYNIRLILINQLPTLSITSPISNSYYSETQALSPQISVSDADNNNITCKYFCDSETTPRETKVVSNTITAQTVTFSSFNTTSLSEGSHTIKYTVSDGVESPVTQTVNFTIDKTPPTLGTITPTSSYNSITLTGSATDNISGLDPYPYRYTIGGTPTSWLTTTSNLWNTSITPNTQYAVIFEARDAVGHISSNTQNIFTKAQMPALTVNNATSSTLDVSTSDLNPASTQYQIWTGSNYVTQTGALSPTAQWITLTGKKITVTGLNPSTPYTFYAQARNGDNVATATSAAASGTTLVATPGVPTGLAVDSASTTTTNIKVTWTPVTGATSYDVAIDGNTTTPVNTTTASFTQTTFAPGTSHTFSVRAKNANPTPSAWCTAITGWTQPGVPTIGATPTTNSMNLSWAAVTGATGYDISVNNGAAIDNGTSLAYNHTGLTTNTQYTYKTRAKNAGGAGTWSNPLAKYTLANVPNNGSLGTPTNTSLTASWQANGNPAGTQYALAIYSTSDVLVKQNAWTANLTDTITGLTPATTYKVEVKARNGDNVETNWLVISATAATNPNPPVIPTWKAVPATVNSGTSITLSWNAVAGATSYDVKRVDPSNNTVVINNITDINYTDTALTPETTYTYSVQAENAGGQSGYSSTITQATLPNPPVVPTGLAATATTINSITLTWTATPKATGYMIEADGIVTDVGNVLTYTYNTLDKGTQHKYRILAYNTGGSSVYTALINASTLLDTPTDITAYSTNNKILVSWSPVTGATSYEVNVGGNTYTTTGTSYSCTGLNPSAPYIYKVRAVNAVSTSSWTADATITTQQNAPDVPTNIVPTATNTTVTITWNASLGATSYDVTADGQLFTGVTGTSYTGTGLVPGSSHTLKVRARNTGDKSAWSSDTIASTLPSAPNVPTSLVSSITVNTITLNWNPVAGAESYDVETDGTSTINVTTNTYTQTGLNPAETHNYRVRSVTAGVQSDWSEAVTATTRTNNFGIPTNLAAVPSDTTAALTWAAVAGATGYDIQVDGQAPVTGITGTSYTATGLTPETSHNIKVRTENNGVAGDWSAPINTITLVALPQAPTGFKAKAGQNSITLTWNPLIDATSYDIEIDSTTTQNIIGTVYTNTGLNPSTPHTYRIRTVNGDGAGAWSQPLATTTLSDIPAVPSNITLTPTNNTMKISWKSVDVAGTYDVEIDGAVTNTVDTQYLQTGLSSNTSHTYRVRAVNGTKTSDWSTLQTISTLPDKPVTPDGINITTTKDTITINYNNAAGATGYDVEVDGTATDNGNAITYTKPGLTAGTQHTVRVRAKNAGGTSDWSVGTTVLTQSDIPGIPGGIATNATTNTITITWAAVAGATSYDIETDGTVTNTGVNTQYIDLGLTPGAPHTYRVRANNSGGNGNWSAPLTKVTPFAAPANLTANTQSGDIALTWNAVEGATSYDVEIDGTNLVNVTGTTYTNTGVQPNQKHTYRVRAKNAAGIGTWSTSITAQTSALIYTGTFSQGDTFDFVINAQNIPDINSARITITYDLSQLDVADLYSISAIPDLTTGNIPDSNIKVVQFTPGMIILTVNETELSGEYSGIIDTITFKSKTGGQVSITYSVN